MTKLEELDKLEIYLEAKGYDIQRVDTDGAIINREFETREQHQIFVYRGDRVDWSVICHWGSYGYEDGLLEVYGSICSLIDPERAGSVVGWLTADDIIRALEAQRGKN